MFDPHIIFQDSSDYWNRRVAEFGHTGWSNPSLYSYDQRARIARIMKLVNIDPKASVLDFGCGTGEFAALLSTRYPKASVTGIDLSEEVISIARDRIGNLPNIKLLAGKIDEVSLEPGAFDLILCVTVLQHINPKDLSGVLARMTRLLSSSGQLILLENTYQSRRGGEYINTEFDESGWREVAAAAGLKTEYTTSYPHWGCVVVEFVLPLIGYLRGNRRSSERSSIEMKSIHLVSRATPSQISLWLVRLLLSTTWLFDHVFKLPLPSFCRRYAIFLMTKKA